jgi:thioredoxin 1
MAGNNIIEFTGQNFEDQVLKAGKPVLVDFWAPWCAPCRMMGPTLEAVAQQYAGRALVGKLNVDDNQELATRYNIRGIPALLLFKGGQVQEQMIGATSKDKITQMIDKHLGVEGGQAQEQVIGATSKDKITK